ncbi:MAG: hypothetical protein MR913_10450 [Clostridiales bacterium]|nr:hypothetical protein [Clostridiales bacterium]
MRLDIEKVRLSSQDIKRIMYTCVNENAILFYEKIGMKKSNDVMVYNHIDWTDFVVE